MEMLAFLPKTIISKNTCSRFPLFETQYNSLRQMYKVSYQDTETTLFMWILGLQYER